MARFDVHGFYRPALVAMLMLTVFACEGGGCSGCEGCGIQPIPGAYPLEHRIDNSAQVRLTRSGVEFIEDNVDGIVHTLVPGGLEFPVPSSSDSENVLLVKACYFLCPGNDCSARIEIESLDLVPTAPNRLRAHLQVRVDSRNDAGVRSAIPIQIAARAAWQDCPSSPEGTTCTVDIDTTHSDGARDFVGLVADISLVPDEREARKGYTRIEVGDVEIASGEEIEDRDLGIACDSDFLDFLVGLFQRELTDLLRNQVSELLNGALGDTLCTRRGEHQCPDGTYPVPSDEPSSICRFEDDPGAECVPILLGADGRGDLGGALLGSFSPGTHGYGQFLLASGGPGEAVNEGMSLFFYGGFMGMDRTFTQTPAHHSCVPTLEPPPLPEIDRLEAFRGNVIPGTTTETHVGIGVAEAYLDYAGYGLFDSGMLCVGAGTRLSQQLSTGLISAAIMSLPDLTFPRSNVPLTIAVHPQQPPDFTVGAGTEESPILQVALREVEIDFYVWSTERYVRFMTFRTDLEVGVHLKVEDNQLVPEVTQLRASNSSVSNSELLSERPDALASTLETIVGTLAATLGSDLGALDIPEIMGFQLEVPDGGIVPVHENGHRFLGIFANLALAGSEMAITAPVETHLSISDLELDEVSMQPEHWNEGPGNRVWLHFRSEGPLGVEYEYSYRIDGGLWSPWTTDERIQIDDDVLLLQARHSIEARSRIVSEPSTVDRSPAQAELVVDILPPTVRVNRTVEGIEVEASDLISDPADLWVRYAIDGTFGEWTQETTRSLPTTTGTVVVEVRDESGNVGRAQAAIIRGLPNAEVANCGCSVPGAGDELPLGLLGLLGSMGLVWTRRRRGRRRAPPTGPSTKRFDPLGPVALVLLVASGCECSEGPACGGLCTPARPPTTTAGTVCCEAMNMCAAYDIADLCDPGFTCPAENLVTDASCGVTCAECIESDPLDPGMLATHLDAVIDEAGTIHVSGYSPGSPSTNLRYGDLVFGQWNGSAVDWEIVDGAPSTPITGSPNGWRGGVTDAGDDVGQWTSMVNVDGTFLITYYDATNGALKLAAGGPGAWATHTIDDTGDSGRYSSLVVTDAGVPVVAYLRIAESSETPGSLVSSVMVAAANLANPSSSGDWTITEVASRPMACRPEFCAAGTTCLESGACVAPTTDCSEACASGKTCFHGTCEASLPRNYLEDLPPALGLYTSLATTPSGGLALVYYDRSSGNIYGATYDGATWDEPFLIDGYARMDPAVGDCGMSADVTVDSSGLWHVVYVDGSEEAVRYARVRPDGTVDAREVVDDGSTSNGSDRFADGRHIVGDDASIVVLEGGALRIVYQDATAQDAVIAFRGGGGGPFGIMRIDTEGSTGYWLEQEVLGNTSYAVMWWRSRESADILSNGIRVIPVSE